MLDFKLFQNYKVGLELINVPHLKINKLTKSLLDVQFNTLTKA